MTLIGADRFFARDRLYTHTHMAVNYAREVYVMATVRVRFFFYSRRLISVGILGEFSLDELLECWFYDYGDI